MTKSECEVPPCKTDGDSRIPSTKLRRKVLLCRVHVIHAMNMGHIDCVDCGRPYGSDFTEDYKVICYGCNEQRKEKLDGSQ